jgi:hypothetical protein
VETTFLLRNVQPLTPHKSSTALSDLSKKRPPTIPVGGRFSLESIERRVVRSHARVYEPRTIVQNSPSTPRMFRV